MLRAIAISLGLLLVMALVAEPIWQGREQLHFGEGSDDAVYGVMAKSIASGDGYRVSSLPGTPYAIKYPPVYPAFLAVAWRIAPEFPRAVRVAAVMQMTLLPFCLGLLLLVLRGLGFSWRRIFLVTAFTTVTLQMVLMTITLFSELLCMCLLFGTILVAERAAKAGSTQLALAAGLLAGLTYLTRNAVLPLFAAVPLFFFIRKKPRLAAAFLLAGLPLAVAWHAWVFSHPSPPNPTNSSYSSEFGIIMSLSGVWENFQKQLGAFSGGTAESFAPGIIGLLFGLSLYHLVPIAAISGAIRIGRRRNWPLYVIFSGFYLVMLLFWWFDGMTRLILPAWPMMLAGIAEEASHVAGLFETRFLIKTQESSWPRWALVALATLLILRNDGVTRHSIADLMEGERQLRSDDQKAFSWIASHRTPKTVVLSWKDATSFLYTGVPATRGLYLELTPQPPLLKAVATTLATLPTGYARGLLVILRSDFGTGFAWDSKGGDGLPTGFRAAARALPGAKLEFASPGAVIYSFQISENRIETATTQVGPGTIVGAAAHTGSETRPVLR